MSKVKVSADGGKSWAKAALQEPVLPHSLTRFRVPWQWDGGPAVLLSRASDESRQRAADACAVHCAARCARRSTRHPRVPESALQQHHELGGGP